MKDRLRRRPRDCRHRVGRCRPRSRRRRQLTIDDRAGNHVLRIQCREPAREIFEFAHIARPAMRFMRSSARASSFFGGSPSFSASVKKCRIKSGKSSIRSRSGGSVTGRHSSERTNLRETDPVESDAQILVARSDDAHVGLDRRAAANGGVLALLKHRSRRVCASIGMSPISSRNSVPPSACSNRPRRGCWRR